MTSPGWLANRLNSWASRRHGVQSSPVNLRTNRIYIVPSRSGFVFALMLLVMLLGSMNYNNSMGLGLAFLLGSIALVTMHHCHRNLLGLRVTFQPSEPVFAGQDASADVTLHNDNQINRCDLVVRMENCTPQACNVDSRQNETLSLVATTQQRGYHDLPRLSIRTRYPSGLFRAWSWVYWDQKVLVYPKPFGSQPLPNKGTGHDAGSLKRTRGNEEFAELSDYQPGDPLNRVAWKHYARTGELHSKTFDEPASTDFWLDWHLVESTDTEARLEQLSAWIEDAHARQVAYGLRLPNEIINPDLSDSHRARCLKALALY